MPDNPAPASSPEPAPHRRRPRYSGKHPRRFEEKYKERDPGRYADTVAKVLASGKTPAGTHRPIMVAEILDVLAPMPGEIAIDCTLGYGGHAEALLPMLQPGGRVIALDADPIELPKTESGATARLTLICGPRDTSVESSSTTNGPSFGIESSAAAVNTRHADTTRWVFPVAVNVANR